MDAEVDIEKREVWESIPVGDDLGTMDYVMTEQMISDYRRVVGNPHAAYPTVAARHPANLFYRKYAKVMRVPNAGHDSQFFNPPIAGKRIFVSAFVADKYIRRGRPYLVVEATAKDEDGRLIETSRLVGMARPVGIPAHADLAKKWGEVSMRPLQVGDRLKNFQHKITRDQMIEFEHVVWNRGKNSHSDPDAAKADGLSRTIASGQNQMAVVHQMLEQNFGDAWVYGGTISIRYIRPVHEDDVLTPHGLVTAITEVDGKPRVQLDVWCENQNGDKTSAGTASAGQPVATKSWVEKEERTVA